MIGVDAAPYLAAHGHTEADACIRFAQSSSEILWYGRIFPKDVKSHEIWTEEPGNFLRPDVTLAD
jgi:hypothetical protein